MVALGFGRDRAALDERPVGMEGPSAIQVRPLMTAGEVAAVLGVGERTVWRLASRARGGAGGFPRPLRISPQVLRWRYDDVQRYLQELSRN